MEFLEYKQLQQAHFERMIDGQETLFVTDVDKEALWETYLGSFPTGTNNVFRERREFDCSCCKQFVRQFGNVVVIKGNQVFSLWDFHVDDTKFAVVNKALSNLVLAAPVKDVFVTKQGAYGVDKNREQLENGTVHTWHHFHIGLPKRFVLRSSQTESAVAAEKRDSFNVLKRSLDEIAREAVVSVLDLIAEKMLYRGESWQSVLESFLNIHDEYHRLPETAGINYCWVMAAEAGQAVSRIRNHSIGVLLTGLSNGEELETAVKRYEAIVAPENYKRPKALFTKAMVEQAQATVAELGLLPSLGRRHAVLGDITINNVLWANRDATRHMDGVGGVFDMLKNEVAVNPQNFKHVEGVGIDAFVADVLPNASSLELLLENRLQPNLVSLIAPQEVDSPPLFKWGNGFSWAYQGNITDSAMKERVKQAGGNVEGVLRFSLQWNEGLDNRNDFDAHCIEPNKNHIYYGNKGVVHRSSGMLDVDIMNPRPDKAAVENIVWTDAGKMQEGVYKLSVHNYAHRGGRTGFSAEIEYGGQIYEYVYERELAQGEEVVVAQIRYDRQAGITFLSSLPSTTASKEIWGLHTSRFQPVSAFMHSPNHWDGNGVGNRHYFFMLAGCINDTSPNGFFNEYLRQDLHKHRRVFEALGSKMRVTDSPADQLSGLGFSSTRRNYVICKVDDRVMKVVF